MGSGRSHDGKKTINKADKGGKRRERRHKHRVTRRRVREEMKQKSFFVMYLANKSACGPFGSYSEAMSDTRSKDAVKVVQCADDDSCSIIRSWKVNALTWD